jgi:regulator of protease activity HflC (stomatin/prohibitin superfamily)
MKAEKNLNPLNGYLAIVNLLLIAGVIIALFLNGYNVLPGVLIVIFLFLSTGLIVISPNNSKVLVLFGAYKGSIKQNGFYWVNPFFTKTPLSLRARNLESEKIKVNDKMGNPIMISVILVWRVKDTFKASFEVDNYEHFVKIQTDSAVRKLAGSFPYDHFEDERATITLSTNFDDVNLKLEHEITERLKMAGLEVIEARIGYLAYAPEIAHSMLRRQQASAVVAARHKIVEGAVEWLKVPCICYRPRRLLNLTKIRKLPW